MFKNINKVIKIIVVADFFYNSAFASFAPIFAIFVIGHIKNGSAGVAGLAVSAYWIAKSIFQLPIARLLDRTDGENDEYWSVVLGYLFTGLIPFAYLFVSEPWHLYLINAVYGFIMAWTVPAWYSIFTRHVDKWRISFEWSLESVFAVGVATAAASALGGYIADNFGFNTLFIAAGAVSIASSFMMMTMKKHLLKRKELEPVFPERPHHKR